MEHEINTPPNQSSSLEKSTPSLDDLLAAQDLMEDDEEEDGFLARVMEASKFSKTHADELSELHTTNRDAYEAKLDDMATEIAMRSPEFVENIATLKNLRSRKQGKSPEAQAIIRRQNELLNMYQRFIISEANIPDETRYEQMQGAKLHVAELLQETHGETYTGLEAIKTLGFYTVDEETNKRVYRYPEELFPESVTEKWYIYLASVCKHSQAATKVENGQDDHENVVKLDRQRRYAHLSATTDIHQILDFEEKDPKWTYEHTKNLLANIRDSILPNTESANSPAAKEFVEAHTEGLDVCESLCNKSKS